MAARKLKKAEHLAPTARYQLLVHVASGGMGAVYLGIEKSRRDQILAIKRAHSHLLEDAAFRKMFAEEARLASLIRHPNAIGVIDVDESDDELLMVMPYLEGGSLGEMLVAGYEQSRRVPPAVALRIVIDAARGLQAAHQLTGTDGRLLGLVHRDVSPHNILVGVTGTAAIVDFGVAKAVAADSNLTATGVLKGKTAYMSPEYIGKQTATPQTDVFSLGVVCWEALANRRLFKAETEIETMQQILGPKPAPMLTDETAIDTNVAAIIARSLVKDPTKRFHTAAEFADALERRAQAAEMLASPAEVAAAVKSLLATTIDSRAVLLREALHSLHLFDESTGGLHPTKRTGKSEPAPSGPSLAPVPSPSRPGPIQPFVGEPSNAPTAPMAPTWQRGGTLLARTTPIRPHVEAAEGSSPAQAAFASVIAGDGSTATRAPSVGARNAALWGGGAAALVVGVVAALVLTRPTSPSGGVGQERTAPSPPRAEATPTTEPAVTAAATNVDPTPESSASASTSATAGPPANASASPPRTPGGWRPKANPYNQ